MLKTQLDYLHKLERFEKVKPGLIAMRSLMTALENPQNSFPSIHIAGTNGKGSTAAFLSSVLNLAKLKTGLYTSPHLDKFNERIVVSNKPISDKRLSDLIKIVRNAAKAAGIKPTYFEFTTAIAFLHLAQQKVDIAIIEVGMGGDLDATNVISPILSIITNIGMDHTKWLGQTRLAIASRKAGIIKEDIPLITAEEDRDIIAYLKKRCGLKKAPVYILKEHLKTTAHRHTLSQQTFKTSGLINGTFLIPLLGEHQIKNAALAILATHVLNKNESLKKTIRTSDTKKGLSSVRWPGRFDIVSKNPFIIIDGAHNEQGYLALSKTLDSYDLPNPDVLVIGIKSDKEPKVLLDNIVPRFRRIIVTEANYDPYPATKLSKLINQPDKQVQVIPKLTIAIKQAKKDLKPKSMLLITGSLYLAGDALSIIRPNKKTSQRIVRR